MGKQMNPLIKIEVSGGVASYQVLRGKIDVTFVDHDDCEGFLLEGNELGACTDCRAEWKARPQGEKMTIRKVTIEGRNTKR